MKFKKMCVHSPVDGCGVTRMSFSVEQGYTLELLTELRSVRVTYSPKPEWHNTIPMENIPQFTVIEDKKAAKGKTNADV